MGPQGLAKQQKRGDEEEASAILRWRGTVIHQGPRSIQHHVDQRVWKPVQVKIKLDRATIKFT